MTKIQFLLVSFCFALALGCTSNSPTVSCFLTATGERVCVEGYSTEGDVDGDGVDDTFICADSDDDGNADDGDADDDGVEDSADTDDDDDGIDDEADTDDDNDGIDDDEDCDEVEGDDGDDGADDGSDDGA